MNAHQPRRVVASGFSLGQHPQMALVQQQVQQREQAERQRLFSSLGYELPVIEQRGPRLVVASTHKLVEGQVVRAEALGFDARDAEQRLVKVLTRP